MINHRIQIPDTSQITEMQTNNNQLEVRTLEFGKRVIRMGKQLPRSTTNFELYKQGLRSATSIGANYREANEAISRKDFAHRLRIARKEAKETTYWLELLVEVNPSMGPALQQLIQESIELRNILSAIITKAIE